MGLVRQSAGCCEERGLSWSGLSSWARLEGLAVHTVVMLIHIKPVKGRRWVCGDNMYQISFETKCGSEKSQLLSLLTTSRAQFHGAA